MKNIEIKTPIAEDPMLVVFIIRVLGFPFFLGLAIVSSVVLLIKFCYNYINHGGEAISYTQKTQRHGIEDVYQELVKTNQNGNKL